MGSGWLRGLDLDAREHDPDGHDRPDPVRGSEPFVAVDGTIDAQGNFQASGRGTVAGMGGVTVRMEGSLRGCGTSTGTLEARYIMGANGELSGGVTYEVRGSK